MFFKKRFLENEWVVETVYDYYLKGDIEGAVTRLINEAIIAWEREDEVIDDITCLIAFFGRN